MTSTACPDWRDRLADGRTPIADVAPVNPDMADAAVKLCDRLHLPDVPGQPAFAEAGGEWFRDLLRAVFGSLDPHSGERGIHELFLLVPKKNSKTTNAAALGLTAMLLNARHNAEMVIIAPRIEAANTCFAQAAGMIQADPTGWLKERFHVIDHQKTIRCRRRNAQLKIKTFDARMTTGSKPVLVILDELHLLGPVADASEVIRQLRGGMIPFPESLLVTITTQSFRPPAGAFRKELDYARGVRDGRIEDATVLPCLYEFPEEMQRGEDKEWRNPETWARVLPNLDRSITLDRLKQDYARAIEMGLDEEISWASQHLNVEIGMGLAGDRWVGADHWLGAAEPGLDLETLMARSDVCTVGVDGGGLDDLLGLAVVGRDRETRVWRAWCHAWAHPEVRERRTGIVAQLDDYARDGDLTWCTDPLEDVQGVADIVERLWQARLLPQENAVGLDPWGVGMIVEQLAERGLPDKALVAVGQGARLSPAIWTVERKLSDGSLTHAEQRLTDWCVGNCKVEQRGSAVTITKQTAGRAKIDPVIALFNAVMLMSRNPAAAASGRSYLTDSEMMVLA